MDSSTSYHITPDSPLFVDIKLMRQYCHITMSNGLSIEIKHVSSVQVGPNFFLRDVLHVSAFELTLLSICELTNETATECSFLT